MKKTYKVIFKQTNYGEADISAESSLDARALAQIMIDEGLDLNPSHEEDIEVESVIEI